MSWMDNKVTIYWRSEYEYRMVYKTACVLKIYPWIELYLSAELNMFWTLISASEFYLFVRIFI